MKKERFTTVWVREASIMLNEKEHAKRVFNLLYGEMEEFVCCNNGVNKKNEECFVKLYENMAEAFANSEDALYIRWDSMWDALIRLSLEEINAEDKRTENPLEITAKYKDIDVFFGILQQCMIFMADSEMHEDYINFIKNTYKKTKNKFKRLKDADMVPWEWMWQTLMNSDVYSMMIDEQKNNRDSYLKKDSCSNDTNFLSRLMFEDINSGKKYSRFISVVKKDYVGYDFPMASGTNDMKDIDNIFKKIVRELDKESQIEEIFTHVKEGGKRPTWEVSAVNAKALYKEIDEMGFFGMLDYRAANSLYQRYCCDDGEKTSYENVKKLMKYDSEKADCGGWYEEYKRLDKVAEILCDLVPMVYYGEHDSRQIKTYSRWREDCEKIIQIVHEKALPWGIDQVEVKAAELVASHINKVSEIGFEEEVQACVKERYLEYLMEESEKFFQFSEKVYWILKNVEDEKDWAGIVKEAFDSLDVN